MAILTWFEIKEDAEYILSYIDYELFVDDLIPAIERHNIDEIDVDTILSLVLESTRKAWEILVELGCATYYDELEYCEVLINFIALVDFYIEGCGFISALDCKIEDYYIALIEYFDIEIKQIIKIIFNRGFTSIYKDLIENSNQIQSTYFNHLIKSIRNEIESIFQNELGNKSILCFSLLKEINAEIDFYLKSKKNNTSEEFEREEADNIYIKKFLENLNKNWKELVLYSHHKKRDEVALAAQALSDFFGGTIINMIEENQNQSTSKKTYKNQKTIIILYLYVEPSFTDIGKNVIAQGLSIDKQTLRRYHLALKTRKFVILAGISGTGKTWLTKTYANAVEAEYLVVPVAPNWTTNEDLLGYFNPIDKEYNHTAFSHFLERAAEEYKQAQVEQRTPWPYHLVLDEMNLARVEYYFATFLSAMEIRMREEVAEIELAPGKKVLLPPNLYFIGTVNMDETTHGFADKVYDRAQLIELEVSRDDLYKYLGEGVEYRDVLMQIWDEVHEVAPFAFRVFGEIKTYVKEAEALEISWRDSLDEQLLQKILPKLKGTDERVGEALNALVDITEKEKFTLSNNKIKKMLEMFNKHGFTSYF